MKKTSSTVCIQWQVQVTLAIFIPRFILFNSSLCYVFDGSFYFNIRTSEWMAKKHSSNSHLHQLPVIVNLFSMMAVNPSIVFHLSFSLITIFLQTKAKWCHFKSQKLHFAHWNCLFYESIKNNSFPTGLFAFCQYSEWNWHVP